MTTNPKNSTTEEPQLPPQDEKEPVTHSSGPWHTVRDNGIAKGWVTPGCRIVWDDSPGGNDVAYIVPLDGDNGNANARLIAAAPDLLEVCKLIRYFFDSRYAEIPGGLSGRLDAAIAKAEQ